jgi:predicted Zn-dependent protease
VGTRPVDRTAPGRVAGRPGPLVARPDLDLPQGYGEDEHDRSGRGRRSGRVGRFVHRYGWRAYAVPLLTVATLLTLGDLATSPATSPHSVAATTAPTTAAATTTDASPAPVEGEGVPDGAAELDAGPSDAPQPVGTETYVEKGAGTVSVVDVTSVVSGSGPLRRFAVEIENGIGVDGAAFAAAVRTTLSDPRSWGNGGRYSFQEVGAAQVAAGQYEFKVTLISPGNMDAYCPGLRTNGYTSCRVGERAVINVARWATAVPHYDGDVATYRHYVVNHEVGHALGNGHVPCPGPGQVAPVMLQQTLGLDGCVKNAWPYP